MGKRVAKVSKRNLNTKEDWPPAELRKESFQKAIPERPETGLFKDCIPCCELGLDRSEMSKPLYRTCSKPG